MPIPDMSAYLNAMLERWGPMMDVGLERMRALPEREAMAFDQYIRDKRVGRQAAEEDILLKQLQRKMLRREMGPKLAAAPKSRYSRAMGDARTAADAGTMMKGRNVRDMLQVKDVLDRMTTDPVYGTNRQFFNVPAASAMTNLNLPRSGFDTYAALMGSAGGVDPTAGSRAQANVAEADYYRRATPRPRGGGAGSLG